MAQHSLVQAVNGLSKAIVHAYASRIRCGLKKYVASLEAWDWYSPTNGELVHPFAVPHAGFEGKVGIKEGLHEHYKEKGASEVDVHCNTNMNLFKSDVGAVVESIGLIDVHVDNFI
jgi:hypothetical protein